MDLVLTLVYIAFTVCLIYPPTEVVSAGLTIPQLFSDYLGSENTNFIEFHIRRITITTFLHSVLPLGYVICNWLTGWKGSWLLAAVLATTIIALLMLYQILCWWEKDRIRHPVVKALLPYVTPGRDWRIVAADVNVEFWSVEKVCVPLSATSKLIATQTWLVKVGQYTVNVIKQTDCSLVATASDSHDFSTSGEDEVQYINIEVIPTRADIKQFSFRITTTMLRDLQPRLANPVRVPDHISLLPTVIERFVTVFKQHVDQNPIYFVDEDPELCIGCMQVPADVKINQRCLEFAAEDQMSTTPCQTCNCRVLWCSSCMGRWWAARASGPPARWLQARGSCPVCRARFCLLDLSPVQRAR